MTLFQRLTCLDHSDLNQHAASLGAVEAAFDDDNPATAVQTFLVAHRLRRQEWARAFDGAATPELDHLVLTTNVHDEDEGERRAHYAFRDAVRKMAQAADARLVGC